MDDHPADRLQASIDRSGSLACVGLDPRPELIPPALRSACLGELGPGRAAVAEAFRRFNAALLAAVAGRCAAVKPQVACYEAYGWQGMQALEDSIATARRLAIPVIVDGKRNDIGSTATHYQQAWLGAAPGLDDAPLPGAGGDWLTVNGYLGSDGITPFLQPGTGIYVLVKTSNPGSAELQGQACGASTVMEHMAGLVSAWGAAHRGRCGLSAVGAVVGATWPEEARRLRECMPDTPFLVPGYGAQGGAAADALAGLRSDGSGVLVNSSRGIIGAWQQGDGTDYAAAAEAALQAMNADLDRHR